MTAALIAALGVIAALIALVAWVVTIVRAAERDRAAAMVLAEKLQGQVNLERERATASIAALAKDVRAATRRADALEEWARDRAGAVDNGTDLLLAELSIIAAGAYADDVVDVTPAPGSDPRTGSRVSDAQAMDRSAATGGGDPALDETLPGDQPP